MSGAYRRFLLEFYGFKFWLLKPFWVHFCVWGQIVIHFHSLLCCFLIFPEQLIKGTMFSLS